MKTDEGFLPIQCYLTGGLHSFLLQQRAAPLGNIVDTKNIAPNEFHVRLGSGAVLAVKVEVIEPPKVK